MKKIFYLYISFFPFIVLGQNFNNEEWTRIFFMLKSNKDTIIIDGKEYLLGPCPLSYIDKDNYRKLYSSIGLRTLNYTNTWEVKKKKLYLKEIRYIPISLTPRYLNSPLYTQREILKIMEDFTGSTVNKHGDLFMKNLSGNIFLIPISALDLPDNILKSFSMQVPIYRLTIKKGKVQSMDLIDKRFLKHNDLNMLIKRSL